MDFEFLKKYIVEKDSKIRLRHTFYSVKSAVIQQVDKIIKIPVELETFYNIIGYGYMFDDSSINIFYSPEEFVKINLRQDYYEFDPTLEYFNLPQYQDKRIFFQINESNYLLIDKEDISGKNAIYYFDEKIADSLEEFLQRFDEEPYYFEK